MCVRVSPYLLSLIDWSDPVRRSAAPPVHPARARACCPITRSSALDSLHEQADAPVPGLTHRYPDKALFLRARHLPGLLPLLHAQLRGRRRHRGGREGPASRSTRSAGSGRSRTSRSRPELEDIVVSGGDAYNLRAEQITRDRRRAARDAEHPPHPLRDQGPGGDAAEDPHRPRVDRRADRASSSSGRKLHKEVVLHTHFNHPNEITGDHRSAR